jgi:hypothetical protein
MHCAGQAGIVGVNDAQDLDWLVRIGHGGVEQGLFQRAQGTVAEVLRYFRKSWRVIRLGLMLLDHTKL